MDLLFPATSFEKPEALIHESGGIHEIAARRFSHKRATVNILTYLADHVKQPHSATKELDQENTFVEVLLVQPAEKRFVTSFFDGELVGPWPEGSFDHQVHVSGAPLRVVSR